MLEKGKLVQEAFSWMSTNNLLATKPMINIIYDNIKLYNPWHKSVLDVDFLLDEINNKVLIYIDFQPPWWIINKKSQKENFEYWVLSGLKSFIPQLKAKITFDKEAFTKMVQVVYEKEK